MPEIVARTIHLLSVFLLLALPGLGEEPCAISFPHDSNPTEVTDQDICNFHKVDAEVYRGGRPRPSAYPKLAKLGIRTIVNFEEIESAEQERAAVAKLNLNLKPEERIEFISFPISQVEINRTGISDERVRNLFREIQTARKPVFIHCFYGKDRTGAVVVLYRMVRGQMSYQNAYEEALHYRFSRDDLGLKDVIGRYKNPSKLNTLRLP